MQLTRRQSCCGRIATLGTITLSLLALVAPPALAAGEDAPPVQRAAALPTDTSTKRASFEMASYTDSDHVAVFTPSIAGSIENVTGGVSLRGRYLVDVVSAASVDIVSTASRRWSEVRHAASIEGEYKPRNFGVAISGSTSTEPDYFSYTAGVQMTHDFDAKNTTLVLGYAYGHDTIGRTGTSFSVFSRELTRASFTGGVTQVIDAATVASVALDVVLENGDQSKPYRYIPMFAPNVAGNVPLGASIEYVTAHRLTERPLEQLPLTRRRFAGSGRIAHRFASSTLRASERLYDDTWGLKASTTDARWIFDVSRRFSLWPHARFHAQAPVSFWKRAYAAGAAPGWDLPELRTGDRELGPLRTVTGGAGVKWLAGSDVHPQALAISVQGDVMHTWYLDDLYVTSRVAALGAVVVEGEL